ncbi:MAG: Lrp/AsnC family transcriptional regulator [Bacteroidota bacterium]
MNTKDTQIIQLLQSDGKLSYAQIGEEVNLSITAVKERINKLVKANVLKQNVYIPNPDLLGFDICAFVQVLMPIPTEETNFIEKINAVKEVQECHFITGEYSYLLKIRVQNTKILEQVLGEKIKTIKGVVRTNTIIALTTTKESLMLNL